MTPSGIERASFRFVAHGHLYYTDVLSSKTKFVLLSTFTYKIDFLLSINLSMQEVTVCLSKMFTDIRCWFEPVATVNTYNRVENAAWRSSKF